MKLGTRIGIGVGIGIAALAIAPFLLPLNVYRTPIERAASAALGREFRIKGPLGLTIYPQIGISLADVTIANTTGARDPNIVSVGRVVVGAKPMPLLSGVLEITEIVLDRPVIRLEVNERGEPNWGPASNTPVPAGGGNQGGVPQGVLFNTVSITKGELSYFDPRSNTKEEFSDIGVRLVLSSTGRAQALNAPLTINGSITYNSEPLKIDARIERLSAMLAGQPTQVHLGIASAIVNADVTGSLASEGRFSGALKMGARSVRSFAAWTGHPMPPGNGFGLIAIDGQFTAGGGNYALSQSQIAFDSMKLGADISIDTNGTAPLLKGVVKIDRLDITPYLAPGQEADTVKAARNKAAAPAETPLEFGWLKAADAEMRLALGGLITPSLKLDQAVMAVNLKGGVLKADLSTLSAYGGSGKGSFTLDASREVPSIRETFELNGLKAQPFLTDLARVSQMSGTGTARIDLSTRGRTEAALIKGLNGRGSIKLTDGTISGVDLAAVGRVLQSVATAEILMSAVGENAKTNFGQFGGTFTVNDGVLTTSDLALVNPSVELNAKGSADLAGKTLDFRFEPKAKRGIPGLKLVDIGLPFYVRGPWAKPEYGPDTKALPKAILDKLGSDAAIPEQLLKDPGNTLKSLFGIGGK